MAWLTTLKQQLSQISFKRENLTKGFRLSLICGTAFLTGCSDLEYNKHKVGELKGRLIIEWISSDSFRFLKHATDPLRFTRHDGMKIVPGTMITDGGSVPAALRSVKTYSPWGFGPAFVIHDWLFQMKSCKLPGYEKLTLDSSADIMAEIIKTMMESKDYGEPDKLTLYSMHQAVKSRYAKEMWENGVCVKVPRRATAAMRRGAPMASPELPDTADEPGTRKATPQASPKEKYSGDKAVLYEKKMKTMKKVLQAPAQFTFEKSYSY